MRFMQASGLLLVASLLSSGCAPVFSELQSAKLVGEDEWEITPSVTEVQYSNDGESDEVQTHVGFQAAYGLRGDIDLRIRYERITVDMGESDSWACNILAFGPKFETSKDKSAFYVPVGFAYGENIDDISKTWEIHPTLLFTLPLGDQVEFNPSAKALIALNRENSDVRYAVNLGAGLSTNLDSWAIRPEIGFLFNPGSEGHFIHFSIGLTLHP